jgi:hypothetical protein
LSKFDGEVEEGADDDDDDEDILVATMTATSALFFLGTDAALGMMGYEEGRTNADDAEEEEAAARDIIRRKVDTPAAGATMVPDVSGLRFLFKPFHEGYFVLY